MENKVGKKAPKHLDDDEDRKNPAYIPRKGLFFEHDLRGQTQEEEVRYVRTPPGAPGRGRASLSNQRSELPELWPSRLLCPAGISRVFVVKKEGTGHGKKKTKHRKPLANEQGPAAVWKRWADQQLGGREQR